MPLPKEPWPASIFKSRAWCARTPDDRGVEVGIMVAGQAAWPSPKGERAVALYKRVNEAQGPIAARTGWYLGLANVAMMVFFGFFGTAVLGRRPSTLEMVVPMLMIGAVFGLILRPLMFKRLSKAGPRLVEAITRDGLCATCMYQLGGLVPEPDGCVVCPECGSAWRAERIRNPESFAELRHGADAARFAFLQMSGTFPLSYFRDDRGLGCGLVSPWMWGAIRTAATPELKDRLQRARRLVLVNRLWVRGLAAAFFGLASAVFLWVIVWPTPRGGAWRFPPAGMVFGLVYMLGMIAWVILGRFGYQRDRVAAILVKHRLCPSCAGDLTSAAREPDGCVVCPTCEHAWFVKRGQWV